MKDIQTVFVKLEARRASLGISKVAVAQRSGVSLNTVKRILAGKEERPALASLHAIAKSLGTTVHFGAEQEIDSHEFRKQQAERKARDLVRQVQGTMALEAQAVNGRALEQMVEQTTAEILAGPLRTLWEE